MTKVIEQEEVSLKEAILISKEWLLYVKAKWIWIVIAGMLGGSMGLIYAINTHTQYIASLNFVIDEEKGVGGSGGLLGIANQFGFDIGAGNSGSAFSGANLMGLIMSRTLVEKTLLNKVIVNGKQISLAEYYIDFNGIRDKWKMNTNLNEIVFLPNSDRNKYSLQQDSVLGELYQKIISANLVVSQKDKKLGFITIEAKTENELFSKLFVEVLAKEVSEFYIETKSKKAKINVEILEKQTDSIRAKLNEAITGVAYANDNTYNLNPALNVKRAPSVQKQIDVQANTVILTQLVTNLEIARVTLRKETPLIQIIDKPILPLKKEKYSKFKSMISIGFLFGFICTFFISLKFWWRRMMNNDL